MNLGEYVTTYHIGLDGFDMDSFKHDVKTCVRFLDNVLDVNTFALEDNKQMSHNMRRIGLGFMGLADALIKMGYKYNSDEGRAVVYEIASTLRSSAVKASQELAKERGAFPYYDKSTLTTERRHVALVTVAPTGTISMLMGTSGGVEPIYSPFIYRKIGSEYQTMVSPLLEELLSEHEPPEEYASQVADSSKGGRVWDWDKVTEALGAAHGSLSKLDFIPDEIKSVFVCAHDVKPRDHVLMQTTVQNAFDDGGDMCSNSISKTINMPNEATIQDVFDAYTLAFDEGAKGITVYRDGSRQLQVLNVAVDKDKKKTAPTTQDGAEPGHSTANTAARCPECSTQMTVQSGCETCMNSECGYSKCDTGIMA